MRPSLSLLAAVSLSLALGACATTPAPLYGHFCPREGGAPYRTLTSDHFVVHTSLPSEAAQAQTQQLEQLRRALLLAFGPRFDPPGRLEVYLVASEQEWSSLMGPQIGGFFVPSISPRLVMPAAGVGAPNVFAHELTHHLHAVVHPLAPGWLREGIAGYLETATVDASGRKAELGRTNLRLQAWLKVRQVARLPWLWDTPRASMSREDVSHFYASSWAWVHFLLNARPREFAEFQRRLAAAEEPRAAFLAAFGLVRVEDTDTLYPELLAYFRTGRASFLTLNLPPAPTNFSEEELPPADAHAHALELRRYARQGGPEQRRAAARLEITRGLSHDPRHVGLRVAQAPGVSEDRAGALGVARQLTAEAPDAWEAWDYLADALASEAPPDDERLAALQRVAELRPGSAQALNALAWAHVQRGEGARALPLAERAAARAPWSAAVLDTWAAALLAAGRCPDALRVQRRAMAILPDRLSPEGRAGYESRLAQLQHQCGGDGAR